MSLADDFLGRGDDTPADWRAAKDASWEQIVVRAVLTAAGLPQKAVIQWQRENAQPGKWTLAAVRSLWPGMPVYLSAANVPYSQAALADELLDLRFRDGKAGDRFWKGRLYKAYSAAAAEAPPRVSVGIVFRYPEVQHLLLHDRHPGSFAEGTFFLKAAPKGKLVVVEPFRQFLYRILEAGEWRPKSPDT